MSPNSASDLSGVGPAHDFIASYTDHLRSYADLPNADSSYSWYQKITFVSVSTDLTRNVSSIGKLSSSQWQIKFFQNSSFLFKV